VTEEASQTVVYLTVTRGIGPNGLLGPTDGQVAVGYRVSDRNASDIDYLLNDGFLTFLSGETVKNITLVVSTHENAFSSEFCRTRSTYTQFITIMKPLTAWSVKAQNWNYHGRNTRAHGHKWSVRVKVTPRLLKIHLSLLVKKSPNSRRLECKQIS